MWLPEAGAQLRWGWSTLSTRRNREREDAPGRPGGFGCLVSGAAESGRRTVADGDRERPARLVSRRSRWPCT